MPEHIKALIFILALAGFVFAVARRPASELIGDGDFLRRRNAWIGLTLLAFLSHNFWVYAFAGGLLMLFMANKDTNPAALFLSLIFAVPAASIQVPGLGLITYLVNIDHLRLLALFILVPAFLALAGREDTLRLGRTLPDKLLLAFLVLFVILQFRETTVTDTLRRGFLLLLDVFLPYYVISRSLRTVADFRVALLGFVMAALIMAGIAVFEAAKHWQLYTAVVHALGLSWGYNIYLDRAGTLRAIASTGQPIPLGYALTVAIGFYLFLRNDIAGRMRRNLGLVLLTAGLLATLSRGPWVGALALLAVYLATGPQAPRRLAKLAAGLVLALAVLAVLPIGQTFLDLLPFVGSVDSSTVEYRQRLIDNALAVINRNPWLGSVNFAHTPEMQAMLQGQGIIDVVNTYLLLALEIGYVGMGLFAGFFGLVAWGVFKGYRQLEEAHSEERHLGRVLFATLIAVLLILFTTSPITIIPIVYWSLAGMGVAYVQMLRARHASS